MNYIERTDNFMATIPGEVYRVGGSVRDELLGRRVKDADYMVRGLGLSALGVALKDAAVRYDPANRKNVVSPLTLRDGRQAGWRVGARGLGLIEVVLPRTERPRAPKPGENRHRAFEIVVDPELSLEDDACRRDFTFNALYRPVSDTTLSIFSAADLAVDGLIEDPTKTGLYDLSHQFIRTTHPDSFRDDPLRTLRALRFVSTLGYDLTSDTLDQMKRYAPAVDGLSAKGYASGTVFDELCKLLMGEFPARALRLARDTGVLATLLPELAPMLGFDQGSRYHDLTTDEHTFQALTTAAHVDAPLRVRMALLFHDSGKPAAAWVGKDGRKHYYAPDDATWSWVCAADGEAHQGQSTLPPAPEDHEVVGERLWRQAAERLNVPKSFREEVATLIRHHMVTVEGKVKPAKVRRARVRFGDELLRDLYLHRMCDLSGKGKANEKHLRQIGVLEQVRRAAEAEKVPTSTKELAINGYDLIKLGVAGRQIGEVLHAVLDELVVQPSETKDRDWQLARAEALGA